MRIYEAALAKVPQSERLAVLDVYLARASEFFGVGKVRPLYCCGRSCVVLSRRPPH